MAPFHPLRHDVRAAPARTVAAIAVFVTIACVLLAGGAEQQQASAEGAGDGAVVAASAVPAAEPVLAVPPEAPPPEAPPVEAPPPEAPPVEAPPVEQPAASPEPAVSSKPPAGAAARAGGGDDDEGDHGDDGWSGGGKGRGDDDDDGERGGGGKGRGDDDDDGERGGGGKGRGDDDDDDGWSGGGKGRGDDDDDDGERDDDDGGKSGRGRSDDDIPPPSGGCKGCDEDDADDEDDDGEPGLSGRPQVIAPAGQEPDGGSGGSDDDLPTETPALDTGIVIGSGTGSLRDVRRDGERATAEQTQSITTASADIGGTDTAPGGTGSGGVAAGDTADAGPAAAGTGGTGAAAPAGAEGDGDQAGGSGGGGGGGGEDGERSGSSDEAQGPGDRVVREIRNVVNDIPEAFKAALAALAALSILLGIGYFLAALRARRLARQRRELLQEVGLLQTALLPPVPDKVGALLTTVAYRPADGPGAGGDFYDVLPLPGGRVGFILGDVSGHGRGALARTAFMRYTLRAYLEAGLEPRVALQVAGRVIDENLGGDFATVLLAVHDPETGSLTYATAGHPAPLVVGPEPHEPVTAGSSPPIGVGVRTGLRQTTVPLVPGSVAALFTDGLMEARTENGILGRERLQELLEEIAEDPSAHRLIERVAAEATLLSDDMAAVVVMPTAGVTAGLFRTEQLELSARELDGPIARRFLTATGLPEEDVDEAEREARELADRFGGVVLHVVFGNRLSVEVLPRNVESIEAASRRVSAGTAQ